MRPLRLRDPAPPRWRYRLERLMLTPLFWRLLRTGLPLGLVLGLVGAQAADPETRAAVADRVAAIREQISQRPEFQVAAMAVEGADADLAKTLREVLALDFPVSSFELDLAALRELVAAVPAVESASLRIRSGNILEVNVVQRLPVAIWRASDGLKLIDARGAFAGPVGSRAERPDLPLVVGDGARSHVGEALRLMEVAQPLGPRVRALVRMGERRWDLMLDRGQRVLLPAGAPVRALERVLVLDDSQDLLARDITVVDMRNPARPVVRLNPPALASLRQAAAETLNEDAR